MWIAPKQLCSAFAADTLESSSGSDELSRISEQSLMWRSKPSPARIWSRRWKRVSYEIWGTRLRQDYLQRQSAGPHTDGKGCSSWPTPNVPNRGCEMSKAHRPESGGIDLQSAVKLWPTPAAQNYRDGKASPETMAKNARPLQEVVISGLPDRENPNTTGKSRGLWQTPEAANQGGYQISNGKRVPRLGSQAGGRLNPDWVEQLMGIPVGWTDCDCAATASYPPRRHRPG